MIITGNPQKGLAKSLYEIFPQAVFCSRTSGYDLTVSRDQDRFADEATKHDNIILSSALWKFQQTVLLDKTYKKCREAQLRPLIICIGSTTDRVKNGKPWLYNAEKKALRDYTNTLALGGVWDKMPRVSYMSFGTLRNKQEKHPDRKCLEIRKAAEYVAWLINQPKDLHINEISIDPIQHPVDGGEVFT